MSNQSTLTSIRLDADTLQELDMLVGQDGIKNRSDVTVSYTHLRAHET